MTVKELIEELKTFDENSELVFKSCIESGRRIYSYILDGSLQIELDEDEDNKVVLGVYGEEDYFE